MKGIFQTKDLTAELIDMDEAKKMAVVYFSKFGNVDLGSDLIQKGAFSKSLTERQPKGLIYHISNHRAQPEYILSKCKFEEDSNGLKGFCDFSGMKSALAQDHYNLYAAGLLTQHSIGFITMQEEQKSLYNEIQEIKLFEGSSVMWGMNPEATTVEVKGEFSLQEVELLLFKSLKALRNGKFTDETFGLIEIQAQQYKTIFEEKIKALTATEPHSTLKPEPQKDLIQTFKKQLNFI